MHLLIYVPIKFLKLYLNSHQTASEKGKATYFPLYGSNTHFACISYRFAIL